MQKALWFVLAALMFAGTASVVPSMTTDTAASTSSADPGEGSYPIPQCMPGGTCK